MDNSQSKVPQDVSEDLPSSRRHLLQLGAAGAVAAAAALVAGVASSPEAKAANGGNFILGQVNSATAVTTLSCITSNGSGLKVVTSGSGSFRTPQRGIVGAVNSLGSGSGSLTGVLGSVTGGSAQTGVWGQAVFGQGVVGKVTNSGSAIFGSAPNGGTGIVSNAPKGPSLRLNPVASTTQVPPTSGTFQTGSFMVDSSGHIWYCTSGGTPGTWIKLSGTFIPLNPSIRAYDSRVSSGGPGPLAAGTTRTISLNVSGGVPKGASAALLNLTVVDTQGSGGYLTLYAANASNPGTSNINWSSPGTILANNATVAVDPNAAIIVYAGNQATDFIIDILGYYL
jgi:hypothetical protein